MVEKSVENYIEWFSQRTKKLDFGSHYDGIMISVEDDIRLFYAFLGFLLVHTLDTPLQTSPLWPIRSTSADQVHFGRSGPLWPIKCTLADQVPFGRSGPLWPIRSTLADQLHFGRSGPQVLA